MSPHPRRLHRVAARARRTRVLRYAAGTAVTAAAMLALAACGTGGPGPATPANNGQSFVQGSVGTTVFSGGAGPLAPRVTGTTLSGRKVSLSQFRGHVLVMNFWGSWCTPCRAEAPTLATLSRQYRSAGVRFLGVDLRDSRASAQGYMRDFGITYPSISDPSGQVALDFRTTVPPNGIPTTLVISPAGRITARIVGQVTYQSLRNLISATMARSS